MANGSAKFMKYAPEALYNWPSGWQAARSGKAEKGARLMYGDRSEEISSPTKLGLHQVCVRQLRPTP